MTIKTAIIGATTAASIALGSIAVPATATAASPFAALKTTQIETQAVGVEEVKRRRFRRGHRRHRRGVDAGTAAVIGLGAFAIGAAIAAGANSCRTVYVERWSRRHQAYVVRKKRVC